MVQLGAGDDESKRRLGPWGLPRDLLLRGATRCAARCRTRALLWLAVFDRALVGALGSERQLAFGLAHRGVGRPDAVAALPGRGAGLQSRRRIFLVVSSRPCVLAAAANLGAAVEPRAWRKGRVVARGADDRVDRADDDLRLSVDALDEVIAAPRDDVHVVAG